MRALVDGDHVNMERRQEITRLILDYLESPAAPTVR